MMFGRIREDIGVVFERDPAARTTWEVLTCYPGLHALVWHRAVVHPLWTGGLRWLARWLAHWGRWLTGIESDTRFFSQAGSYLRIRPSVSIIASMRERFRRNPSSGNLWNALYGLREAGTPEAKLLLEEMAADSTDPRVRQQAEHHLQSLREIQEQLGGGVEAAER